MQGVVNAQPHVFEYDPAADTWRSLSPLKSGLGSVGVTVLDGKIYAINELGTVYVFAAEPTFKLLAKNTLGESVIATPAVADNRLFIRGDSHLFCIGKPAAK